MCYCLLYTVTYGIGTWQCSWAVSGNANTTAVFEAKFGWDKDKTIVYNTIISTAGVIGMSIGCLVGGSILKFGRRNSTIIA